MPASGARCSRYMRPRSRSASVRASSTRNGDHALDAVRDDDRRRGGAARAVRRAVMRWPRSCSAAQRQRAGERPTTGGDAETARRRFTRHGIIKT